MSETLNPEVASRLKKVSSILVTQAKPADDDSPYYALAKKYKLKIDFRPFIEVQGVSIRDFRKQKINILDHTAVIFTSKNAVDNFFRISNELRLDIPIDMKYFCVTESTANYLQKYIQIRKRKVFVGAKTAMDLTDSIKKHKEESYLRISGPAICRSSCGRTTTSSPRPPSTTRLPAICRTLRIFTTMFWPSSAPRGSIRCSIIFPISGRTTHGLLLSDPLRPRPSGMPISS
jgi:hypothetical protein